MSSEVEQSLNDIRRMRLWQHSMPPLELDQPCCPNEGHRDYLKFYGLLGCAQFEGVKYYAGYKAFGSDKIFHQLFLQTQPSELVLIVHGYTDHAGLFARVIRYLLASGRSVLIYDQQGHGLSSGERASIASFGAYVSLLHENFGFYQAQALVQKALGQRIHILAQSMGGAVTMRWLLQAHAHQQALGKVILFAPLVRPKAWKQALWSTRFLSLVIKSVPRPYSANSEDQAFSRFVFYQDPVQHDRVPTQWVKAMIESANDFDALAGSEFPLWIIQGDNDGTVDWEYNLPSIKNKFPNAVICMVPEARHHLAGESARLQQQIFACLEQAFGS